jgi:hypothetical protein
MTRALAVVFALAVVGTAYLISTRHVAPLQRLPHPAAGSPAAPMTTDAAGSGRPTGGLNEAPPAAHLSDEQRVGAIKHAISKAMADSRDEFARALVASGLAPADSEPIAQRLIDGLAGCIFEAARDEYEARGIGLKEFLDGAEIVWSQPLEMGIRNLSQIQSRAAPCVANASQQAGIPMPVSYGPAADQITERFSAGLESPPWAAEMEARIRDHIASHPSLALTRTLVKCRNDGCNVMLVGDVRIFDLDFDRFAEQNGFRHAVLGGDTTRFVWLQR